MPFAQPSGPKTTQCCVNELDELNPLHERERTIQSQGYL